MSDRPSIPALPPDRSALPALLEVETWIRDHLSEARTRIEALRSEGETEIARMREDAEGSLEGVVADARREAARVEEDRARDRVSGARKDVEAWVVAHEARLEALVTKAVEALTQPLPPPSLTPRGEG